MSASILQLATISVGLSARVADLRLNRPERSNFSVREIDQGMVADVGTLQRLPRRIADGLNYVATWNAAMLMSDDLDEAMVTMREKRPAKFND